MRFTIGIKKDMTQIFDEKGDVIPCTILDINDVVYVGKKEKNRDDYNAVVLGIGRKRHPTKSEISKYKKLKYIPEKIFEFRVDDFGEYEKCKVGDKIKADVFEIGEKVKVTGVTKGKGFQGVVKRWGFKGGKRTHGQSDRERAPGSIGAGTDPGRVFKGKKMPGHMGNKVKSVLNLKIVKVDKQNGIICIKGGIPGGRGSLVKLYKET